MLPQVGGGGWWGGGSALAERRVWVGAWWCSEMGAVGRGQAMGGELGRRTLPACGGC